MKKISVIGSGYVGLVAGTCLADFGLEVICVDNDKKKIEDLRKGKIPIYEPGLELLVEKNVNSKRLSFTTNLKEAVENSEVIFIAVGTPPKDDGSADLQYVLTVAEGIGKYINNYKVVVDKSTVPIGTGQKVKEIIKKELKKRNCSYEFDVVSNPEFLREGSAVRDFTHPDRVVIGTETEKAANIMKDVYRVLYLNETPFVITNIKTAEMIKYASNAFLAMKITYINELANLCEKIGADVHDVAKAMGRDGRISPKFLHPGPGYGGSCFPKDTRALAEIAKEYGERVTLIEQTIKANEKQKLKMVEKIKEKMGNLKGKTIAILGLTFKQNTDDMRESSALVILPELVKAGAKLKVFDPQGIKESKWRLEVLNEDMIYCEDEYTTTKNSDALVILTEWNQFRGLDLNRIRKSMKDNYFFDFRNLYTRSIVEEKGFIYDCVGR